MLMASKIEIQKPRYIGTWTLRDSIPLYSTVTPTPGHEHVAQIHTPDGLSAPMANTKVETMLEIPWLRVLALGISVFPKGSKYRYSRYIDPKVGT